MLFRFLSNRGLLDGHMLQISCHCDSPSPRSNIFLQAWLFRTPPSSSVTIMSRIRSVTVTPLWNCWWRFGFHDEKQHEILNLHLKFQVLIPGHSAIMKFLMWSVGKLLQNNHASRFVSTQRFSHQYNVFYFGKIS